MRGCHNSANRKALYFRTLSSSTGFFVYYCLPIFLSPSLKEFFHWGRGLWQVELVAKGLAANAGNARDVGLIPGSRRSLGVGSGTPLQNSCLENSMGRGAWQATVHGAAKSRTRLSTLSSVNCKPGFAILCWSWIKPSFGRRNNWQSIYFR